jgi:hypothetical protein
MSSVHVCLVSDQTIPNILSIHHFKPDKVIFCTTEKMENQKRTDAIINTLKLYGLDYSPEDRHLRITVDQDCLDDCELKFSEAAEKYRNSEIVVNLTGGTKIMVLGAYNIIKSYAKRMIYTPIPKNEFITVYPKDDSCKKTEHYNLKLSVEAYVTAYGFKIKNRQKIEQLKSNAASNKELCKWMALNYGAIEDILFEFYKNLNRHRSDKNFRLKLEFSLRKEKEREFLKKLGMANGTIEKTLSKNEIRFLTGDWVSDYSFNEIAALLVDDCVTGIELVSPNGADNEFDVMFTKDNALYIAECKSLQPERYQYKEFLYKISSLQQDFGLRVDGYMVSTARRILTSDGKIDEDIIKRAKQCRTKVMHPDDLGDVGKFIKSNIKGLS